VTDEPGLPDAAWCDRIGRRLAAAPAYRDAIGEIGTPLFVKLKEPGSEGSVILRFAADGKTPVHLHGADQVEEEGLIVSTDTETWGRLLRGSADLTTAVMGRDVRVKGSMFKIMKIADPAERIVQAIARATRRGDAA
jgi:hypothetical protein